MSFLRSILSFHSQGFRLQLVVAVYSRDSLYQVRLNRRAIYGSRDYSDAVRYFMQRAQTHALVVNPLSSDLYYGRYSYIPQERSELLSFPPQPSKA